MKNRILAVDDREGIRLFIAAALSSEGFDVTTARDGHEALLALQNRSFDLLITDLKMPRMDGMTLLRRVRSEYPTLPVIVLTAHGTVSTAVEAIKLGATDYLTKPLESPQQLRDIVHGCLFSVHSNPFNEEPAMISSSSAMEPILKMIDKVAPTDATVLLTGQSGTGKEVAARIVHARSHLRTEPFIPVNCAAISPHLVESEMFGHEKGAFTGAIEQKKGRFEVADGGTLFLDEIGELPLPLQAKILRVLQERSFERVGGTAPVHVQVRIIAATNRNLQQEIQEGRFREDLYHRLAVFPISLPALSERPEDIIPLAAHFLAHIQQRMNKSLQLSEDAASELQNYHWPGNIRELGNVIERSAILATPPWITKDDLQLISPRPAPTNARTNNLRELEKQAIISALSKTDGHRKKTAHLLGIGLRTLYHKLKEYGIE